jgi:hypothetical protein
VIAFVAGLCFVAAAVFAVLWWRARAASDRLGIDRDAGRAQPRRYGGPARDSADGRVPLAA